MRNKHHIVFERNAHVYDELIHLGFKFKSILLVIDIYEDDPHWPAVCRLIDNYPSVQEMCYSELSATEIKQASWINIYGHWHWEYPQPSDDLFGFMPGSFDMTNFCFECGSGDIQIAPIRILREPKWGSRKIFMLHWLQDAYFVPSDIWEKVFYPYNIDCWPVLKYPSGKVLSSVVQLKIDKYLPGHLKLEGISSEVCPVCHRIRYGNIGCGCFPSMSIIPNDLHIARSQEIFGGGKESFHETFISQALYENIQRHSLKGLTYIPVCDTTT